MKPISPLFTSETFSDALRNTISVALPVGLAISTVPVPLAIAVAIGVMSGCLTDLRGTTDNRKLSTLASLPLFFGAALVTTYALPHPVLLGVLLVLVVTSCSLFSAYGKHFTGLGIATILVMVFVIGLKPPGGGEFSLYLLAGSAWYGLISLLQTLVFPYRSLRHGLADCLQATGDLLHVKARFYDVSVSLDAAYKGQLDIHARITEKQEQLRSLLLHDSLAMRGRNTQGARYLEAATEVIDLYEQISANYYDYTYLRKTLSECAADALVIQLLNAVAAELQAMGRAVRARTRFSPSGLPERLTDALELLSGNVPGENATVIVKIVENTRRISRHLANLQHTLFEGGATPDASVTLPELRFFAPEQRMPLVPAFRFSIRLAATCLVGYVLPFIFPLGHYPYWILLTIVIIMRPSFLHTQKRTRQRLLGSLAGAVLGWAVLRILPGIPAQLLFCLLLLFGFFFFNFSRYTLAVICITAMVVICLSLPSGTSDEIFAQRLLHTAIGSALAFFGSWLLPVWERKNLDRYRQLVVQANATCLDLLVRQWSGAPADVTAYKVARKNLYLALAGLSSTTRAVLAEPGKKPAGIANEYRFEVLNYSLGSAISSLSGTHDHTQQTIGKSAHRTAERSLQLLHLALKRMQNQAIPLSPEPLPEQPTEDNAADLLLKLSADIYTLSVPLAISSTR